MKIKEYKNGASVIYDDSWNANGIITVLLRKPNGDLEDKIKAYEKRTAKEYFKAFCAIAKNMKG